VIQNVAGGVRSIRNEMNISPNQALDVRLSTDSEEMTERILRNQKLLTEAANIDSVEVEVDLEKPPRSATFVREDIEGFVPLEDVLDPEDEVERLEKQVEDTSDHLEQVEQKLDNDDFVENAPDDVVQRERDKREELSNELAKLKDNLADWSEQV
jgi:valyl-tRNA synthetase